MQFSIEKKVGRAKKAPCLLYLFLEGIEIIFKDFPEVILGVVDRAELRLRVGHKMAVQGGLGGQLEDVIRIQDLKQDHLRVLLRNKNGNNEYLEIRWVYFSGYCFYKVEFLIIGNQYQTIFINITRSWYTRRCLMDLIVGYSLCLLGRLMFNSSTLTNRFWNIDTWLIISKFAYFCKSYTMSE